MEAKSHRRIFINAALVVAVVASLFAGLASLSDAKAQERSRLGTIAEFHPELGLGALQGYLDPKALPNSLRLLPPPPVPGSAAFAHDEDAARATFALRDTPRFALAASDFDLKLSALISDFPAR